MVKHLNSVSFHGEYIKVALFKYLEPQILQGSGFFAGFQALRSATLPLVFRSGPTPLKNRPFG